MTVQEFESLSIGDEVIIKRGKNQGMKVKVVYIDDTRSILVRTNGNDEFKQNNLNNPKLRLTNFRELDIAN